MKKYIRYWYLLSVNSFSAMMVSRFGGFLFLLGKGLRFSFFLIFIVLITQQTKSLSGYTLNQAVFFFLTFNIIDTVSQLLFREVYRFRQLVVYGNLDHVLVKPISPLFRSLLGGADPFDLLMMIPFSVVTFIIAQSFHPTVFGIISYFVLIISGLLLAGAIHIFVLGLAILTTEIDHSIMIYRDITSMGRVPIDIYREPLRGFLTFVIPVGIMFTFPAKALMGLLSVGWVLIGIVISVFFLILSIKFWKYSLIRYSSASS